MIRIPLYRCDQCDAAQILEEGDKRIPGWSCRAAIYVAGEYAPVMCQGKMHKVGILMLAHDR